jgi:HPt (histidine-containing phosphotransfer) domain-containing protein
MRHLQLLLASSLTVVLAGACGKSEEEKAAERAAQETREAAEALEKAAESASGSGAQALQEFAKAMEGMAGAMTGTTPEGTQVDPVSVQALQSALPELSGWDRATPTGERMTAPVAFSEAETYYTMGETNVTVKIVDSAFSQMLVAPWAMFLTAGYERESSDGYEKSVDVGGNPGFERWNKDSRTGELNLVVAKRYLVSVEGHNISDTKVLHEFASKIDAGRLSSLGR